MNWYKTSQTSLETPLNTEEANFIQEIPDVEEATIEEVPGIAEIQVPPFNNMSRLIQVSSFRGDTHDDGLTSLPSQISSVFKQVSESAQSDQETAIFVDVDETLLTKLSNDKIMEFFHFDSKGMMTDEKYNRLKEMEADVYFSPNGKDIIILRPYVHEFLLEIQGMADHIFVLSSKSGGFQSQVLSVSGLDTYFESIYGFKQAPEERYNSILIDNLGEHSPAIHGKISSMGYEDTYIDSGRFYPEAITFTNLKTLKKDKALLESAQGGDAESAGKFIMGIFSNKDYSEVFEEIREKFPDAFLVPVPSISGEDGNEIPKAFARYLEAELGLMSFEDIQKSNRTMHTHSDSHFNLLNEGSYWAKNSQNERYELNEDVDYVIVDDVMSSGGTIASLKSYLDASGGTVVGAITLSSGRGGKAITAQTRRFDALISRFGGHEELSSFLSEIRVADGKPENLTNAQIKSLLVKSADETKRIFTSRRKSIDSFFEIDRIHQELESVEMSKEEKDIKYKQIYDNLEFVDMSKDGNNLKEAENQLSLLEGVRSPYVSNWYRGYEYNANIMFCEESDGFPAERNRLSVIVGGNSAFYLLGVNQFNTLPDNSLGMYLTRSRKNKNTGSESGFGNSLAVTTKNEFLSKTPIDSMSFSVGSERFTLVKSINDLYKMPNKENEKMSFNLGKKVVAKKKKDKKKKLKKKKMNYVPDSQYEGIHPPTPPLGGREKTEEESTREREQTRKNGEYYKKVFKDFKNNKKGL